MNKEQLHTAYSQWRHLNEHPKGHCHAAHIDEGKLIVKYYRSYKGTVKGRQFIIEYDEAMDLYDVTYEEYRDCEILKSRKHTGIYADMLDAEEIVNW